MDRYRIDFGDQSFELRDQCLIGSHASCDIALGRDPAVAATHARVTACAHGVVVENLQGDAAVRVDGAHIAEGQLLVGNHRIQVGETVLELIQIEMDRPFGAPLGADAATPLGVRPVRESERVERSPSPHKGYPKVG